MPTVLRQDGFRVVIYLNDHLLSHVHAIKGEGEVRVGLGSKYTAPALISVSGKISDRDIAQALFLVKNHQSELLAKWRELHA
jgi:Domain of unknown function (DUF4160)